MSLLVFIISGRCFNASFCKKFLGWNRGYPDSFYRTLKCAFAAADTGIFVNLSELAAHGDRIGGAGFNALGAADTAFTDLGKRKLGVLFFFKVQLLQCTGGTDG